MKATGAQPFTNESDPVAHKPDCLKTNRLGQYGSFDDGASLKPRRK